MDESNGEGTRDQLPAMTFQDGGPPYEEDEDLHSPIVTASRHKKHKSSGFERGRSPGEAAYGRGSVGGLGGYGERDGPGDAVVNYPYPPQHRDSNFAKPLQRNAPQHDRGDRLSEVDFSEAEDEDTRFSKDYSFTIASPDEEMHGKALALFDFQSEHENELALKEGQVILVSYRHGQGWLVAEDPRTGESGLVPEEFVRLVRDIEGGLNGLNALDENGDPATLSPISNDPGSASTPTPGQMEFPSHVSRPSGEKHPPVQSTFSTSSKDFLPSRNEENPSPHSQKQT
jgi:SH3 domain